MKKVQKRKVKEDVVYLDSLTDDHYIGIQYDSGARGFALRIAEDMYINGALPITKIADGYTGKGI